MPCEVISHAQDIVTSVAKRTTTCYDPANMDDGKEMLRVKSNPSKELRLL